ncbi:MAG: hypothetical protein J6U23_05375, partial [Clostridiales bacterium]|nr:hypothetical protein [Clostridiales bacterium]
MTNKVAIQWLKGLMTEERLSSELKALDLAIKALEDRSQAITNEDIKSAIKEGFANGYEMAKAKFERPTGEWIILNGDKVCPFCRTGTSHNTNASISFFQFCPYCG